FSLALAQRGANVTGIEARLEAVRRAEAQRVALGLSTLRFVQADVKAFTAEAFGAHDVVLAFGILYHLDRPVEWLRQIAGATGGVLVVDWHYAPAADE